MFNSETDAISLLADGLALVYHEARHVRHIVRAGYLAPGGWEQLLSLPTDREEAWRSILKVRQAASGQLTSAQAMAAFERRFSKSIAEVQWLYDLPHWRHAKTTGGHAWRQVTEAVAALSVAIDARDAPAVETSAQTVIGARHNNGLVRCKIRELDTATGVVTGSWWE